MYYILYNNNTKNLRPEIDYGDGIMMPFKIGYILFDANTNHDYRFTNDSYIIDGIKHSLKKENIFHSKTLAEIRFLQLKLSELKASSFDFFMPKSFKTFQDRYDELIVNHPEYVL